MDAATRQQLRRMQFKAKFLSNDVLQGAFASAFRGHGREFEKLREYSPGDDVRFIDWNVTARWQKPFVKEFRDERELTIYVIVDARSSLLFGSTGRSKWNMACEVSSLVAWLGFMQQHKVGLVIWQNGKSRWIPPARSVKHLWALVDSLWQATPSEGMHSQPLHELVNEFYQRRRRRAVCFVISDFLQAESTESLRRFAFRHDVVAVHLQDPFEWNPPAEGIVRGRDFETGMQQVIDFGDHDQRLWWVGHHHESAQRLEAICQRYGLSRLNLHTGADAAHELVQLLHERQRQMRR